MGLPVDDTIDYWKSKFHGNTPPFRYDFENIDKNAQFLLTYDPVNGHKIRSAGLYFEMLLGATIIGRTLESLFEPNSQVNISATLNSIFNGPSIAKLNISIHNDYQTQIALMPVRAEHGPIEYALGVINLESYPEQSAPKLTLQSTEIINLRQRDQQKVAGFAEEKSEFKHKTKPQFRVIDGDIGFKEQARRIELQVVHNFKREP